MRVLLSLCIVVVVVEPLPPPDMPPQMMEGDEQAHHPFPDGMTPPGEVITDMPQHLVKESLNADFGGRYVNQRFHFQNHQDMWEEPRPHGLIFRHNCLRQFMTCMLAMSAPEPVCAYNRPDKFNIGYWSADSSCHVYFDNCRRRFRVWRIVDTGHCVFHPSANHVAKDPGYEPRYKLNKYSSQT